MTHICISEYGQHWFRFWSAPNHCLNQCWYVVSLTHCSKIRWNFNRNTLTFTHENEFRNIDKVAAICLWSQCYNSTRFRPGKICTTWPTYLKTNFIIWPPSPMRASLVKDILLLHDDHTFSQLETIGLQEFREINFARVWEYHTQWV